MDARRVSDVEGRGLAAFAHEIAGADPQHHRADDAKRAVEGVSGIVVSNHGGRQMDTAPATIDVLPRCAEAVGGRVPVLLDGGVRRGLDVLKAIALGATAVQVGHPVLWGLTAGGQGVESALDLLVGGSGGIAGRLPGLENIHAAVDHGLSAV